MDTDIKSHLENFSLKNFFSDEGVALDKRLADFAKSFKILNQTFDLYRRVITSPAGSRVMVKDLQTQQENEMIMFGSNNYLGLANHPNVVNQVINSIRHYGIGAGGPPLLNGNTELHIQLEKKLAEFKKQDDSILFSSGFSAQLGWITALINKQDIVFCDEFSHTSFYEGLKLVGCKIIPFRHNDIQHLQRKLELFSHKAETTWVCCEGVYSMDGDISRLPQVISLAKKYQCKIAIDDAHGTGVLGKTGSGICEHYGVDPSEVDIHLGTFSKAFGTVGGFVSAKQEMIDYMRYMAKSHMFSGALPVPVVSSVLAGLNILKNEPQMLEKLHQNVQYLVKEFNAMGIETASDSAIIPIIVPELSNIREMGVEYHQQGIFLNMVEYPAVPINEQRFRISVMSEHTQQDLDQLLTVTKSVFKL